MDSVYWNPNQLLVGSVINFDAPITNLNFHKDGRFLIGTTESSVVLIDSVSGQERKRINCKSQGIGKAVCAHHESCVLVSSAKKSPDIRYLSLHDNRYIRAFDGHTSTVTAMSMCPTDDRFITVSDADGTVLMWDMLTSNYIGKLQMPQGTEKIRVAYDDGGLVFGIMSYNSNSRNHSIRLYDPRMSEKGPFQEICPGNMLIERAYQRKRGLRTPACPASAAIWNEFEFSTDGMHILVNTVSPNVVGDSTSAVLILDGFNAQVEPSVIYRTQNTQNEAMSVFRAHTDTSKDSTALGACFSTDGKFVLVSNDLAGVDIYEKQSGSETVGVPTAVGSLKYCSTLKHVAPAQLVKCNPKYDVVASASSTSVALWIHSNAGYSAS